ncbi:carboxypeptidase regulatory-like domain-containing protein [Subtercola sp. YIM 133946]|uniref:carboxypeptidase regulatory-like domain-containing protein n=1 Tax=Subtercola sp. YIM 133946 TaxID=3118909 RepID=UPI002F95111D
MLATAAAVLALGFTVVASPSAANAASSTASITGVVKGAGTPNTSLQNALVILTEGPAMFSSRTDATGRYTIQNVPAGTYYLEFISTGAPLNFAPQWWKGKPDQASSTQVVLKAGDVRTGFDAVLAKGSSISGTVTSAATKKPLPGVTVEAHPAARDYEWAGSATTDAKGNYTIVGLTAGTYKLDFARATGYAYEWWDGSPSPDTAKAVTVAAGAAANDVSPTLVAEASVSGNVQDAGNPGAGLANVTVNVTTADGGYVTSAGTDANGNFTVSALLPGSYRFQFIDHSTATERIEYWNNQFTSASATPLALTKGQKFVGMNVVLGDRKLTAPVPTISGSATVGSKLTVNTGTWGPAPVTLSYHWLRNGTSIADATKSTYTLTAADRGAKITVKVMGKKFDYVTASRTSAPTASVK